MISVIINNRDLLTWPKAMVSRIERYAGVGEIIIVDNGSTYEPLLEWYKTSPCKIVRCKNLGHAGAWISGEVNKLTSPYVVTDSDLGLDDTPDDTLLYLEDKMNSLQLDKIGLGLNWEIVSKDSPYYNHVNGYEKNRWMTSTIKDSVYLEIQIDTTFALYKPKHYFIGGASTTLPYTARHYPWELSLDEYKSNVEFRYYIDHASTSSSYKTFLRL